MDNQSVLELIADAMDGKEWDGEVLEEIAVLLRSARFKIRDTNIDIIRITIQRGKIVDVQGVPDNTIVKVIEYQYTPLGSNPVIITTEYDGGT